MSEEKVVKMPGISFQFSHLLFSLKIANNLVWTRRIRPIPGLQVTETIILDFHLESSNVVKGFRLIVGPVSLHMGWHTPKKEK